VTATVFLTVSLQNEASAGGCEAIAPERAAEDSAPPVRVVARNRLRRRRNATYEENGMLTIIESGSQAWALAAADGDLHIYSREGPDQWTEVLLSEDAEQIDQDGSSILEALYEQYTMPGHDGQAAADDVEQEQPEDEVEPLDGEDEDEETEQDEEPEAEEEDEPEAEEDDEPEAEQEDEPVAEEEPEEEEQKPRRSRTRTRAKKK
jgi:hypothetical protein